jgi:hypothetical protein
MVICTANRYKSKLLHCCGDIVIKAVCLHLIRLKVLTVCNKMVSGFPQGKKLDLYVGPSQYNGNKISAQDQIGSGCLGLDPNSTI